MSNNFRLLVCLLGAMFALHLRAQDVNSTASHVPKMTVALELGAFRFDDFYYDPTMLVGLRGALRVSSPIWLTGQVRMGAPENRQSEKGFLANVTVGASYQFNSKNQRAWWPYVGVDYGYYEFTGFEHKVPDSHFAPSGVIGARFRLSRRVCAFGEVRYTYFMRSGAEQPGQYGGFFGGCFGVE